MYKIIMVRWFNECKLIYVLLVITIFADNSVLWAQVLSVGSTLTSKYTHRAITTY